MLVVDQQYLPHRADGIRLSKLDDDGAGAELVAGVAGVPVVVGGVAVEEGIPRPADALDDDGRQGNGGNVLARN